MEMGLVCYSHLYLEPTKLPFNFHHHQYLHGQHSRLLKCSLLLKVHRLEQFHLRAQAFSLPSSHEHEHHHRQGEDDDEAATAREMVRRYLHQEIGVSADQSLQIASNCPNYVAMLIEAVHDLDQLSSSALAPFWEHAHDSRVSFTDKLYQVAKRKGDKGILPYFESLGLTLSSASHLARYLSYHTLPTLIRQVLYVKEIFFSDSNGEGRVGKNARRMMTYLSISVDEDLQQTLSFFEKIQARRGGLDLLEASDASFRHLIESFPQLLSLPIETHLKPLVKFLEDIGVPRSRVGELFLLFPPIVFYDIEKDFKTRLQALEKAGADFNNFGMISLKYPWILSTSILINSEKIVEFLEEEKVPRDCIFCAIKRWPHLLGCSVNKLQLMVEEFGKLDIKNKKLGRIIAKNPQLLLKKPQELHQVVFFFKGLGLDEESLGRILVRCPEIFTANIEKTLKRKLTFLLSIGVSQNHLPRVIRKYPEFFVCDVDEALLPRMRYLMKIGLSKKDVGFMVRRFSPLLGYSIEEVLRPKLEFLRDVMKKPVSELVEYPRYFSYSLEKKIKPRYWVLKGRNLECSLKDMLGKNDEEFAAEFMSVGAWRDASSTDP